MTSAEWMTTTSAFKPDLIFSDDEGENERLSDQTLRTRRKTMGKTMLEKWAARCKIENSNCSTTTLNPKFNQAILNSSSALHGGQDRNSLNGGSG